MANANMAYFGDDESTKLTETILRENYIDWYGLKKKGWKLNDSNTFSLKFCKVTPYSEKNDLDIFKTDPFDLKRLFYKKDGVQQVALIHPDFKQNILAELRKFNITEDFVYPDMDNVANEISEQINK